MFYFLALICEPISFVQTVVRYPIVEIPSDDLSRDIGLLQSIQSGNGLPRFPKNIWTTFRAKWEFRLRTFDPNSKVCNILVSTKELYEDTTFYPDIDSVDLDLFMKRKGCNAIFVHSECQILCATLSSTFCSHLHLKQAQAMSINPMPNSMIINGIHQITQADSSQEQMNAAHKTLSCANFGCSTRPQRHSAYEHLTGSRRVRVSAHNIPSKRRLSYDRLLYDLYTRCLFVVFFQHWKYFTQEDRLYGPNMLTPTRTPRILANVGFDTMDLFRLPYIMRSSTSKCRPNNDNCRAAAHYESQVCRRLAEELIVDVFSPLPYSMCGHVGYINEHKFFNHHNVDSFESGYSRSFPRGSLGDKLVKSLHDDGNGYVTLGLWQCMADDPVNHVSLRFNTARMRWRFFSSTGRFALFNGLVPHESKLHHTR